jgi:hypothetical protein
MAAFRSIERQLDIRGITVQYNSSIRRNAKTPDAILRAIVCIDTIVCIQQTGTQSVKYITMED